MFYTLPKKYMVLAPIGPSPTDGSTSSGGTITTTVNASATNVPGNAYWDAGNPTASQIIFYTASSYDNSLYAVNYYEVTLNNNTLSTPQKINTSGAAISTGYSWSTAISSNCQIDRLITGIGNQKDKVDWFASGGGYYSSTTYSYIVLQAAVPVLKYITLDGSNNVSTTSILAYNSSTSVTQNTIFRLDKSASRGAENGSTFAIYKTDPNGSFNNVAAVADVDYQLVSGTLSANSIDIKFITNYNFTVTVTVNGYTFANNPYTNYPQQTTPNTTTASYIFNTAVSTYDYDIKFPTITPVLSVPSVVQLGTTPFETYQNQYITVTPTLDLSSALWTQYPTGNPSAAVTLTKTDADWRDEINNKLNVTLEIRDTNTNSLIKSVKGLDPYTVSLQQPQNYNFQIITSLK